MKRLVSWLMGGVLLAGLLLNLVLAPTAQAAELRNVADDKIAERGDKIDLNNCSVRRFQAFPGMYPTLAGKIVLGGRWRLAGSFYMASLAGTACTDAVMALTGVMQRWIQVLEAPLDQAALELQRAALGVLEPLPLLATLAAAALLIGQWRRFWHHPDPAWRLAASAIATTLAVDGLFLAAALWAPQLSGLI